MLFLLLDGRVLDPWDLRKLVVSCRSTPAQCVDRVDGSKRVEHGVSGIWWVVDGGSPPMVVMEVVVILR